MTFKILEYVMLLCYKDFFNTSDLQFAFKENASTTQCTWVAKEVISYYTENDSKVYSCLLDCSKAFDKVKHSQLFKKLKERNLPAIVIRLIMYMYMNGSMRIRWGNATSEYFTASNGVKQGSVLSPILFSVYIDELLLKLKKKKDGCWIGTYYYGGLCFADDLKLLAPSITGLQSMLNTCNDFADENGLDFNATKTLCITYHTKGHPKGPVKQHCVKLGDVLLKWYSEVKHLGHKLDCCNSSTGCMRVRRGQFIGVVNQIHTEFSFARPECKCRMLKLYGCSFYGSPLWDLYKSEIDSLYTSWNIAMRTLCDLPYRTHTRYLDSISGLVHIKHILKCRFIKFMSGIINGDNSHLKYVFRAYTLGNCLSPSGLNIERIRCEYGISYAELLNGNRSILTSMYQQYNCKSSLNDEDWIVSVILELLDCKHGAGTCGLSHQQVCEMLESLCIE